MKRSLPISCWKIATNIIYLVVGGLYRACAHSLSCRALLCHPFRERLGNVQGTFRGHSGNVKGTFRERFGNIKGTSRERLPPNNRLYNGRNKSSGWLKLPVTVCKHLALLRERSSSFRDQLGSLRENSASFRKQGTLVLIDGTFGLV
jgi:hypothetical protein